MGDKPHSRMVFPLGGKIREIRLAKGFTQTELARRSRLSEKTISKLENDNPAFVSSIRMVADALGVQCSELFEKDATTEQSHPPGKRQRLILILPDKLNEVDDERLAKLLADLEKIAGEHGMDVIKIEDGSTKVTVEMTEQGAERIMSALKEGGLLQLGITDVQRDDLAEDRDDEVDLGGMGKRTKSASKETGISFDETGINTQSGAGGKPPKSGVNLARKTGSDGTEFNFTSDPRDADPAFGAIRVSETDPLTDDQEELQRLLQLIPDELEREAAKMYYSERLSYSEIGNEIGFPVGGIADLITRAKAVILQNTRPPIDRPQ